VAAGASATSYKPLARRGMFALSVACQEDTRRPPFKTIAQAFKWRDAVLQKRSHTGQAAAAGVSLGQEHDIVVVPSGWRHSRGACGGDQVLALRPRSLAMLRCAVHRCPVGARCEWSRGSCFKSGDGYLYTARPQASRLTKKPMTVSCLWVVFTKQRVWRTRRLMRSVRSDACVRFAACCVCLGSARRGPDAGCRPPNNPFRYTGIDTWRRGMRRRKVSFRLIPYTGLTILSACCPKNFLTVHNLDVDCCTVFLYACCWQHCGPGALSI